MEKSIGVGGSGNGITGITGAGTGIGTGTASLLNLQNLMKRDPLSYSEELNQQWQHYMALYSQFQFQQQNANAKQNHAEFASLVTFLSHVAPCFPSITGQFPIHLLSLLNDHALSLPPHLRITFVNALILLQNRSMLNRIDLYPTLISLFALNDKNLRKLIFHHIISDVKRINRKKKNLKLNSIIQNLIYNILKQEQNHQSQINKPQLQQQYLNQPITTASPTMTVTGSFASSPAHLSGTSVLDPAMRAKKVLDVLIELYRRKVWTDSRTVESILAASLSNDVRLIVASLRFFLGVSFYEDEIDSDEEEKKEGLMRKKLTSTAANMKGVVKNRKKRTRQIERTVKKIAKAGRVRNSENEASTFDCPAIQLINDPHTYGERLFSRLRSSNHSFPIRLLYMNVLSRVIGSHSLVLMNFYPFLQKYLQPHQRHVTSILAYFAQATHPLIPPDIIRPCLLTLANSFVTDRSSHEVIQIGLNSIREICARQPLAMTRSLLLDLAMFKKHKMKGVMMAARSLIQLFREKNPLLLKRRERGKLASIQLTEEEKLRRKSRESFENEDEMYGLVDYATDIPGADLLLQARAAQAQSDQQQDAHLENDWQIKENRGKNENEEDESEDEENDELMKLAEVDEFLADLEEEIHYQTQTQTHEIQSKAGNQKRMEEEFGETSAAFVVNDEDFHEEDLEAEIDREINELNSNGDKEEEEQEEQEEQEDPEEEEQQEEGGNTEEEEEEEGESNDERKEKNQEESYGSQVTKRRRKEILPSEKGNRVDKTAGESAAAAAACAVPFAAMKIFSPADFDLLRQLRLKQAESSAGKGVNRNRNRKQNQNQNSAENHENQSNSIGINIDTDRLGATVNESIISGYQKKRRLTKEERLARVIEGRDEKRSMGLAGKEKGGGTTNAEKLKNKPFLLVKHSSRVEAKKNLTFSGAQKRAQQHIKNLRKQGKKAKRKIKAKRGF